MGMDGDPELDRTVLLERLERLERSLARGEDGLEAYARGFAKLRAELEEVRALVGSVATTPATAEPPPVVVTPAPPPAPPPEPVAVAPAPAPPPKKTPPTPPAPPKP